MKNMVWFREDLRIHDHPALYEACQKNAAVIALFIIDLPMWRQHEMAACRIEFLLRGLQYLQQQLADLNIPLIIKKRSENQSIGDIILTTMQAVQAEAVFYNKQYEINELTRDRLITNELQKQKIKCYAFDDQVILPPNSVRNQQGDFFKVFTAYRRAWYHTFAQQPPRLYPAPNKQAPLAISASEIPAALPNVHSTIDPALWPAGEIAALKRLNFFIENKLEKYHETRDYPAFNGTSQLSPYLSTGMISGRTSFLAAYHANHQEFDTGLQGAVTWMIELIWRDFYKHLLVAVPSLAKHKAYKAETEKLVWRFNAEEFHAWQHGQTGFPIIDAAMRQLNQTGWMHNRLRMITAMYFTKNLFFDWRLGEKYFIQHLIDGDLAANNGGWQWCASTGTDAAPYFRVFNPISQSERFDPDGKFIRQYCPELSELDNHAIHAPHIRAPLWLSSANYPVPTVNLQTSRQKAINAFKAIK